jgi:hypothetical protein
VILRALQMFYDCNLLAVPLPLLLPTTDEAVRVGAGFSDGVLFPAAAPSSSVPTKFSKSSNEWIVRWKKI